MPITERAGVRSIAEYLDITRDIRRLWPQDSGIERRGEEERLWFRGQRCWHWGLRRLDQREAAMAAVHAVAEAEHRKKWAREILLEIPVGLSDHHGPLNAKITGYVEAAGYIIENVLFKSLPGFYITADVYRPEQPTRSPRGPADKPVP